MAVGLSNILNRVSHTGDKMKQRPKRRQHDVPKFYLKGFASLAAPSFLWVYTRPCLVPLPSGTRRNPRLVSLKRVAVIPYRYAVPKLTGGLDLESIENRLERMENAATPILHQLRSQIPISRKQKDEFARYIGIMWKRVRKREAKRVSMAKESVKSFNWEGLVLQHARNGRFDDALKLLRKRPSIEKKLPSILTKQGILYPFYRVHLAMCQMTWRFMIAFKGSMFITSDNPVFFDEAFGLNHSQAVIIFPISNQVTLWASWSGGDDLAFHPATESQTYLMNLATLRQADREVYASGKEDWVLKEWPIQEEHACPISGPS